MLINVDEIKGVMRIQKTRNVKLKRAKTISESSKCYFVSTHIVTPVRFLYMYLQVLIK